MAVSPITALVREGRAKCSLLQIGMRQLGLGGVLRRAGFSYLRPHRFVALRCTLTGYDPGAPAPPAGLAVEVWPGSRLRAWRDGRRRLPVEFFQDEIHGVDTCAVAHLEGSPVGLIWIYRPEHYSRFFRLAPGEAELNYGYVLRAYRRQGLFREILRCACRHLRDSGWHAAYAAVHADNGPSLGAFRGAGFVDVGTVRHFLVYRPRVPVLRRAA